MGMSESLLSGYRSLDLSDESSFVGGKILAALGTETIKVEPPGGDPARGRTLFPRVNQEQTRVFAGRGVASEPSMAMDSGQGAGHDAGQGRVLAV